MLAPFVVRSLPLIGVHIEIVVAEVDAAARCEEIESLGQNSNLLVKSQRPHEPLGGLPDAM